MDRTGTIRITTGSLARTAFVGLLLFAFVVCGIRAHQLLGSEKPMVCEEDEVLVWVDAPHSVSCVPIDELVHR